MKIEFTAEHLSQLIAAITTPWGATSVTIIIVAILIFRRDKKTKD